MKINNRLKAISDFILPSDFVIDIGCDHALLDIYLYLSKNVLHVVGSDIRKKPLEMAYLNLQKYHLENKIKLVCGDGLKTITNENTVIISGMGGELINKILSNIKNYPNIKKIIISPNNDFYKTRKYIQKLGFNLVSERIINEKGKYYLISYYEKGKNKKVNNFFGKLTMDKETINYYQSIINKNKIIIKKLPYKKFFSKLKLLLLNLYIKIRINKYC